MLIVCTHDGAIVNHAQDPASGAANWGEVQVLEDAIGFPPADYQLRGYLSRLGDGEALCLSAHGSDTEIGDEVDGWGFDVTEIAYDLATSPPPAWRGPVLISACATNVANFSAGLAVALENILARNGMWCYGYNVSVDANTPYPDPGNLDNQVDLQGTQVTY